MKKPLHSWPLLGFLCLAPLVSCGGAKHSDDSAPQSQGAINTAFQSAAQSTNVPQRMMLATAYLESGFNPAPASAKGPAATGVRLTQSDTAFGLTFTTLKLDDKDESYTFAAQAPAYAIYVKESLATAGVTLVSNPSKLNDKFDWIANLAKIHRPGTDVQRDLQSLFARELAAVLNTGFRYEDLSTGEVVELKPETEKIDLDRLPDYLQDSLSLTTGDADIHSAVSLRLFPEDYLPKDNVPARVQVIHCPFAFSTCLEQMQNIASSRPRLEAHYVIAADALAINKPIQVARHSESVSIVATDGKKQTLRDAIVIMLTGTSGRYLNGDRIVANPIWYSSEQLIQLSRIISDLCSTLKRANGNLNAAKCMQTAPAGAITFQTSESSSNGYRWGDIPDFNEDIYFAYLQNQNKLPGESKFNWREPTKTYNAGAVDLNVKFYTGISKVTIQQAQRCESGRIVWTNIDSQEVKNIEQKTFTKEFYSPGANKTGQQFVRALFYNNKGALEAWTQDFFNLRNADQNRVVVADKSSCQRL